MSVPLRIGEPRLRQSQKAACGKLARSGGSTPAWIRTKDQLIKSQLLYQLSYRGFALRCPQLLATREM